MSEVNAQLGPFANLFRSGGEKKSTWNSAARDVAKCIKKIAGIRWKRLSLALVFTMVWREVHAGLNCERCVEEKKKKIHFAFGCQNPSRCHVSIYASHTDRYTSKDCKDKECTAAQAEGACTTKQADMTVWWLYRSKNRGTAVQIWRAAPAFGCNNVDDLFCCSVLTDSRSTVARWSDPAPSIGTSVKRARKEQITEQLHAAPVQSFCEAFFFDLHRLHTSDSQCSNLSRTKE